MNQLNKDIWIKRLLMLVLLFGVIKLFILLFFAGRMTYYLGFEFNRTLWVAMLPFVGLLFLSLFALIRNRPWLLLLHLFYGPYYVFNQYGAITEIQTNWQQLDWWGVLATTNGSLTIIYFSLAILTFIFWFIKPSSPKSQLSSSTG